MPSSTRTGADEPDPSSVDVVLTLVREQLRMDVALVSRLEGRRRVIRNLSADIPLSFGVGHTEDYDGTYCQMITDDLLDEVVPDTAANLFTASAPVTAAVGIGSHIGVPIHRRDGSLYGTVCAFSRQPDPTLRDRDAQVMRAVAQAIGAVVEIEDAAAAERAATDRAIDRAVGDGTMQVLYQPVFDLADLGVVGAEALCRFDDGYPPDRRFAAADELGRGLELELAAIRRALGVLPDLPGWIAVNASPSTLLSCELARLLADVDLERVVIELTEHVRVPDYDDLVAALQPLRRDGLQLAIDDAGAGFASMRHILLLEPDIIKIDYSLVHGIATDRRRQAFVEALVNFATKIDSIPLAEGIETEAELAWARDLGVRRGQGFHLARPGSVAAARAAARRAVLESR